MTEKALFRVGACYRQRNGALAKLYPPLLIDRDGRALVHVRCPYTNSGQGHRLAETGAEWAQSMLAHARDLIPGECDEHGNPLEDKKEPETIKCVARPSQHEPERAPLPGYGQSTPFDPFKGWFTDSETGEVSHVEHMGDYCDAARPAHFLCASPDLQDESLSRHQLATVKG